ncbi:hypothetical protein B0H13DRAFT_2391420 [Mycena leptocephala]|nr:hypothetical protein B0H13DRAFT_2391420 [Mycena leptocephala]
MILISSGETRRLFGPSNQPEFNTNVRHRAILCKALELFPAEELEEIFQQPIKLRVAMGSAFTFSQLGKIKTNFVRNHRLVSRETRPLDLEARTALRDYRDAYDAYFMKTGNTYAVRNTGLKSVLQAAEQTWHDWVVMYLAARSRPGHPDWALQPLPGLRRVHIAPPPAPAPTPTSTPRARGRAFPTLPTPPPSSPASVLIDLSHIDNEPARPAQKRKFLGLVDISDDEEDAGRPLKKVDFSGVIDLTI